MHLVIVIPEKQLFEGEVESIKLPGFLGELGVLPRHMPLITALGEGDLVTRQRGEVFTFAIHGGVAQITANEVIVLAQTAEAPEEIDEERARRALETAIARLHEKGLSPEERERYLAKRERAEVRLQLVQRRKMSPQVGSKD